MNLTEAISASSPPDDETRRAGSRLLLRKLEMSLIPLVPPIVPIVRLALAPALLSLAMICSVQAQSNNSAPETMTHEQAQKELDSFVGQTGMTMTDGKMGWNIQIRQQSGSGFGKDWKSGYLVVKKGRFYGVLVSDLIPHPSAKPMPSQVPRKISRYISATLLGDVPKGFIPSLNCLDISVVERCRKSGEAERHTNCQGLLPLEVLAFVKSPSSCSQNSELIHASYRYDFVSKQLNALPRVSMSCTINDLRPAACPPLAD